MVLIRSGNIESGFNLRLEHNVDELLDKFRDIVLFVELTLDWEARWFSATRKGSSKTVIETKVFGGQKAEYALQRDLDEFVNDLVEPDILFAFRDAPIGGTAIEDAVDSSGEDIEITRISVRTAKARLSARS